MSEQRYKLSYGIHYIDCRVSYQPPCSWSKKCRRTKGQTTADHDQTQITNTSAVSTNTQLSLQVVGASGSRVADLIGAMRVHGA